MRDEFPPSGMARHLPVLLFLAAAAVVLSWNLGQGSLMPSDDAIYAQAAREALADGRLLDVTWQGRPLFEKGPVLFWALEAAMSVAGPCDLAVRIPGVLAGLTLLLLGIAMARAAGLSRGAALAGAGMLLATSLLVFNARRPMTDLPGTAIGLAGFILVAFGQGRGPAIAGGALLGLSAMVKLVAPAPFVVALLLLQADRIFRRPSRLLMAFAVAFIVVLPWHAAMAWIHGPSFMDTYVGFHLFRRAMVLVAGEGPSIYATWFAEKEGSTTILIVLAVAGAVLLAFRGNRAARAALALLAGAVLPLAVSQTALPHYLVPLLPGLGLAAAASSDAVFKAARPRLRIVLGWAMGIALAAAFLGANIRDLANPDYGPGAKAVCETLRASGDVERLAATLDLHDPALVWYCNHPVDFLGLEPGFLSATRAIPMLRDVVKPLDAPLLQNLAARKSIIVTVPSRLEALSSAANTAGVLLGQPSSLQGLVVVDVRLE